MEETFHSRFPRWTGHTLAAGEGSLHTNAGEPPTPGSSPVLQAQIIRSLSFSKQDCPWESLRLVSSVSPGAHSTWLLQLPHRRSTVFVFGCFSAVSWISVNNPVLQIAWLTHVLSSAFETVIHSVHSLNRLLSAHKTTELVLKTNCRTGGLPGMLTQRAQMVKPN